ncbi:site-specific integrase [Thalassotalea litorea]|uniref:hypothetical protein n=1 Tax=Thalassotalea litorea TaxID=2020715 RepID=UPI003736EFF1
MNRYIEKYQRQRASGTGMPDAMPVFNTLLALIEHGSEDPKSRKAYTLILWCFLTGTRPKQLLSSAVPIRKYATDQTIGGYGLRLLRLKNTSWVEYSLGATVNARTTLLWLPVPPPLNPFFAQVLLEVDGGDVVFTLRDIEQAIQLFNNIRKQARQSAPQPQMRHTMVATQRVFFSYMSRCANADSTLNALCKLAWFGEGAETHKHIEAYVCLPSERVAYDIFDKSMCYLERILNQRERLSETQSAFRQSALNEIAHWHTAKDLYPIIDPFNQTITTLYVADRTCKTTLSHDVPSKAPSIPIGSQTVPGDDEVGLLFSELRSQIATAPKTPVMRRDIAHTFHCRVAHFACQLQARYGIRPTHQLATPIDCASTERLILQDKGWVRTIQFTQAFADEMTQYLTHRHAAIQQLNRGEPHPSLLLIYDDELGGLVAPNAKWLRAFLKTQHIGLDPYQLRKWFAQTLTEAHCPTHLVSYLMGHANRGEEAGVLEQLLPPPQDTRPWLTAVEKKFSLFREKFT